VISEEVGVLCLFPVDASQVGIGTKGNFRRDVSDLGDHGKSMEIINRLIYMISLTG